MKHALSLCASLQCASCQYVSGVDDLEIVAPESADDPWGCLTVESAPVLPDSVHYSGTIRNLATELPVADAVAHFCASSDETCSDPVRPPIVAPDGFLEFEISGRFNGYIKLESPTMLPAIIELWKPIGAMRTLTDFRMVAPESLALFAATMDASVAPDTGHALYWVDDCDGERAADVSIKTADTTSETKQYYVIGTRLPSLTVDRTDDSGAGGFINLPTQFVTFTAYRASTGQKIAQLSARIRSGTTTFFVIEPD